MSAKQRQERANVRSCNYRGVEQWQLVWLITTRSQVRVLPPLPFLCNIEITRTVTRFF